MIKRMLFIFLVLLPCVNLFAETVFIYISRGEIKTGESAGGDEAVWINCLENGIMDSFFESGHIVFSGNSGKNPVNDLMVLNQLAKKGGASILVSAVLDLSISGEIMETSGKYSVYNLNTDDIICSGTYEFDDVFKNRTEYIEEKLFSAGQGVGNQVVQKLF